MGPTLSLTNSPNHQSKRNSKYDTRLLFGGCGWVGVGRGAVGVGWVGGGWGGGPAEGSGAQHLLFLVVVSGCRPQSCLSLPVVSFGHRFRIGYVVTRVVPWRAGSSMILPSLTMTCEVRIYGLLIRLLMKYLQGTHSAMYSM